MKYPFNCSQWLTLTFSWERERDRGITDHSSLCRLETLGCYANWKWIPKLKCMIPQYINANDNNNKKKYTEPFSRLIKKKFLTIASLIACPVCPSFGKEPWQLFWFWWRCYVKKYRQGLCCMPPWVVRASRLDTQTVSLGLRIMAHLVLQCEELKHACSW